MHINVPYSSKTINPVVENCIVLLQILVFPTRHYKKAKQRLFDNTIYNTKICNAIFHYGVNPSFYDMSWRVPSSSYALIEDRIAIDSSIPKEAISMTRNDPP